MTSEELPPAEAMSAGMAGLAKAGPITVLMFLDQITKYLLESHSHTPHAPIYITTPLAIIIIYLLYTAKVSKLIRTGLILIVAGGVSNIIDQATYSSIRDPFALISLNFNLADIYIITGALLAIYPLIKNTK